MNDRDVLNFTLDLLEARPYRENDSCRKAIFTLSRYAFDRMTTTQEDLSNEEWSALRYDRSKIKAVKLFRDRHRDNNGSCPFTLMEVKNIIERHMEKEFGFKSFPYPQEI